MTAATGLVDAVSVLGLGRVFVANMTGNIVFLGFVVTRRVLSVAMMFGGALIGAVLVLHTGLAWALLPAPVVLLAIVLVLAVVVRRPAPWQEGAAG
jgi:uncharacterized membrane protein YoaK (UPF0700 family)